MIDSCESPSRASTLLSATRVVVFHPHPLVASGLAILLAQGGRIEVTGIASRASALIEAVTRSRPAVVVLGLAGGGAHPDRLISRTWAGHAAGRPDFVVIVSNDQEAADALAVDALAVVTTEVSGSALRDLVRGAGDSGSRRLPPEIVRPSAGQNLRFGDPVGTVLTAREAEVLCGIERGLSTKEIAAHLGISVNTTRTHAQRLMSKLRVHSRLQAAALAADLPRAVPPFGRRI